MTQYGRDRIVRYQITGSLGSGARIAEELGISEDRFVSMYRGEEQIEPETAEKLHRVLRIWDFEREKMFSENQAVARSPLH